MYRDPDPRFESLGGHPVALRPLRVGMIGIGTVGAGTFRVLARNQALIAARAGRGSPRLSPARPRSSQSQYGALSRAQARR